MTDRTAVLESIDRALGGRDLVWFGTRGDDVAPDLPHLAASFSIISRHDSSTSVDGYSLEAFSGIRVDLDAHDIDEDPFTAPREQLRGVLLDRLSAPCAVFTYRPSTFLSAACFARYGRARYVGMFKDHQSAFEHKPWLETQVADLQLPRVPWRYVSDRDRHAVLPLLAQGPVVVRRSRSSGGTGLTLVEHPDQLDEAWPEQDEAFASVAPFIDDTVPVNVGAVVWDDDQVSVDYPSIQLIGIPGITSRRFGYCGNDFAAARSLAPAVLDQIERTTRLLGGWMGRAGYRGAFGVDFLVKDDTALFMEVNARFQGSTHASVKIGRTLGESCVMTDHLAALLHLPLAPRTPLRERMGDCPPISHLVTHHLSSGPRDLLRERRADLLAGLDGFRHADVLASSSLDIEYGATVGRFTFDRAITESGFALVPEVAATVDQLPRGT